MRDSISTYTVNIEHDSLVPEATGNPVKFLKQWLSLIQLPPDTDIKLRVKGVLRFVGHFRMLFPMVALLILAGCHNPMVSHQTATPTRIVSFTVEGSNGGQLQFNQASAYTGAKVWQAFDGQTVSVTWIPDAGNVMLQSDGLTSVNTVNARGTFVARQGAVVRVVFAPKGNG